MRSVASLLKEWPPLVMPWRAHSVRSRCAASRSRILARGVAGEADLANSQHVAESPHLRLLQSSKHLQLLSDAAQEKLPGRPALAIGRGGQDLLSECGFPLDMLLSRPLEADVTAA